MTSPNRKPKQIDLPTSSKRELAPKQTPARKSRGTKLLTPVFEAVPLFKTSKRDHLAAMLVLVDGDRYAVVADRISTEARIRAQQVPAWLQER